MIENPFFHPGPIRDSAYFYNRKKETKRIFEMLGRGQSVSITGPRKIGKTSLLFHLSRPEVVRQHGLDPTRHLVVYFNCEGLGGLKLEEFYSLILEQIAIQVAPLGYHFTHPERPVSYLEFERILHRAFDQKLKLALLLDEFEVLGENQAMGTELLSGLRALAAKFDIAYLTASQRQLDTFTEDYYSPFFNIFVPLRLSLFDVAESRELVKGAMARVGAAFRPEVVDGILELSGRHPFFLQVVGYWAAELQMAKGTALESKDFHIVKQTVQGQIEPHFRYYWKNLSPQEQYILATLPFLQQVEGQQEQLEALVHLCLIIKQNGQYHYFSPLFRDFVRHQKLEGLLQTGPFTLSLTHQQVLLRDKPLPLTTKQSALLTYLIEHQGQVVSSEELDREVMATSPEEQRQYEYLGDERLKSAIKGLRKALGDEADCIINRRGVGYMFQLPLEE